MTKREKEDMVNEKLGEREIFIDDTHYSLEKLNEMFGADVGIQVDCSRIRIYIEGSQGVTSCEDIVEYGEGSDTAEGFDTLEDVNNIHLELSANNALENLEDYLDDFLDGLDPDEMDEDELNELKGEAQAEAEIDSGKHYFVVKTLDGGSLYYEIVGETLVFAECIYF